jgi:DMSO reductase family type II enzyme chaperone
MTIASLTVEDGPQLQAGARSACYRWLARAFSFPNPELQAAIASGESEEAWRNAAQNLPFEFPPDEWTDATVDGLEEGYIGVFEVGPGKPFCALYEGSHRSGRMKLMEDVVRFYEHFGLLAAPEDQPDHICAEFDFMHYMSFKEAAALAHADSADDLRRAQRDFLDRHLCRWLPRFLARLESSDRAPDFYRRLAVRAVEFCRRDLAWLKEM